MLKDAIKIGAVAVAVASMLGAGALKANAQGKEKDAGVKCEGANACKGKGACKGAGNECKGKNACKGKGITSEKDDKSCTDKGGKVVK